MNNTFKKIVAICIVIAFAGCKTPSVMQRTENKEVPVSYTNSSNQDTINSAKIKWKDYFKDPKLVALIETALTNNQELNITMQEIEINRNEIRAKKGEYLPFIGIKGSAGVDKVARFTNIGAMEANTEIKPGKEMPEPLQDYSLGTYATWELDIWNKLHNAKKSAVSRYLSSVEGKNFMTTNLISEIAESYYELMALDNQLTIIQQNIAIQGNVLKIVKLLKESARANELVVKRFEAQVLNTESLQYNIRQKITETENRINFLVGRFPQSVDRSATAFVDLVPNEIHTGIPSQLLENRPDVRQAEMDLAAAKLDVKVAKAKFYPSLGISVGVGYRAFNPSYVFKPESLLYSLAGDLTAPLINRNAIKVEYYNANAKQLQAIYNYERTILNAYIEVANQVAKVDNMQKSFDVKSKQVEALNQSVNISNDLFFSTRADYMEVLITQRDALESKFDLVESKMAQMNAMINIYRALGGGWN